MGYLVCNLLQLRVLIAFLAERGQSYPTEGAFCEFDITIMEGCILMKICSLPKRITYATLITFFICFPIIANRLPGNTFFVSVIVPFPNLSNSVKPTNTVIPF